MTKITALICSYDNDDYRTKIFKELNKKKTMVINTHEYDSICESVYSIITKKVNVTMMTIMTVTMNKFL